MSNAELNDLEIAPPSAVDQAVHDFAAVLAETPEFKAFEQAALAVHQDTSAEQALTAFQAKYEPLQALLRLNAVSAEDQAELERLRQAYLSLPTVKAYAQAEAELVAVCQAAGDLLSRHLGVDFAAICTSGCC